MQGKESSEEDPLYSQNCQRLADQGIAHTVLQLAKSPDTDERVIFNVCDVLLRLLERDVELDVDDLSQVSSVYDVIRILAQSPGMPCTGSSADVFRYLLKVAWVLCNVLDWCRDLSCPGQPVCAVYASQKALRDRDALIPMRSKANLLDVPLEHARS